MKNLTQALSAIGDTNIRNALLALHEENQRLNRELTELQDSVLNMQDDRAEYAVMHYTGEKSPDTDLAESEAKKSALEAQLVQQRLERTAWLEKKQSNLISEQDIRRYISGNDDLLRAFNEVFQSTLKTRGIHNPLLEAMALSLLKGISLDDILAAIRVEIIEAATNPYSL